MLRTLFALTFSEDKCVYKCSSSWADCQSNATQIRIFEYVNTDFGQQLYMYTSTCTGSRFNPLEEAMTVFENLSAVLEMPFPNKIKQEHPHCMPTLSRHPLLKLYCNILIQKSNQQNK